MGRWTTSTDYRSGFGFPNDADLLLEDAWDLAEDGSFGKSLGYPLYIPVGQIARMEIVCPPIGAKEATHA